MANPAYLGSACKLALILPLLAACTMAPPHKRPITPDTATYQNAAATPAAAKFTADWWRQFGSDELNKLMTEGIANNLDLKVASERIAQARAQTRIAGAPLLPGVSASGDGDRSKRNISDGGGTTKSTNYNGVLTASYELDVWGGNRAALTAAQQNLRSIEFTRGATKLAIQADIAATYFQILALSDREKIARNNLAAAHDILKLVEVQFRLGLRSALEVAQQRTAVANFEASLADIDNQTQITRNALAILLGRSPESLGIGGASLAGLKVPDIAPGLPSELLERRPDILAAEASLRASEADIGAARAQFLPKFDLSASAAISGVVSGGTTTLTSLGASVLAPIFSGGQLEGRLAYANSRQRELVTSYILTVLTALQETENALTAVRTSAAREKAIETAAKQAGIAYRLSADLYKAGAVDFLTLLDAQRSQLSAEDNLAQAQLTRLVAAVSLFKALGGGWD